MSPKLEGETMFTTQSVQSIAVGAIEVKVRDEEGEDEYSLGWFPFEPAVLEQLPKTLNRHGIHTAGGDDWNGAYETQFYANEDGRIVFEIIYGQQS